MSDGRYEGREGRSSEERWCIVPCYSVISWVDVQFNNRSLLEAAVKSLGWTIQGDVILSPQGRMTLQGNKLGGAGLTTELVNGLKVAYSKETVKMAAMKYGWQRATVGAKTTLTRGV